MHPRLRDGVSLGAFQKGFSETHYFVENEWEERFEISYQVYIELLQADGTHPIHISKSVLEEMKKEEILTTSRYVFEGIISRFLLIPLGKNLAKFQPICRWINVALPLLATLLFAVSVFAKRRFDPSAGSDLNLMIYAILMLFSVIVHEAGHLVAGISYGYRFAHMGILLLVFLPIGAYVTYDDKKELDRSSQVQFSLAGIEANVLMAAVCLLLSIKSSALDMTFVMVANINMLLVVLNILPGFGFDGESALSACLGMEIGEDAKKFLTSQTFRQKKLTSGISGYGAIALYAIHYLSSVVVGLWITTNILAIILEVFH